MIVKHLATTPRTSTYNYYIVIWTIFYSNKITISATAQFIVANGSNDFWFISSQIIFGFGTLTSLFCVSRLINNLRINATTNTTNFNLLALVTLHSDTLLLSILYLYIHMCDWRKRDWLRWVATHSFPNLTSRRTVARSSMRSFENNFRSWRFTGTRILLQVSFTRLSNTL